MEPVEKPDRYPDHVTPVGTAFWWVEMVYMGRNNVMQRIVLNEDTGKFHLAIEGVRGPELGDNVKALYDAWWFEEFESKFLDTGSDEEPNREV